MNDREVEPATGVGRVPGQPAPAEEVGQVTFSPGESAPPPRSHRRGMLAGLGVVGLLLAVLLLVGPGGSGPRLPVEAERDGAPVTMPVPNTASMPTTTTSSAPPPAAPTPAPVHVETDAATGRTTQAHAAVPVPSTAAPGPTSTPTPIATSTTTTSQPPPAASTTTTTSPPTTTTTTSCILILCN